MCTYAALILYSDEAPLTPENIEKLIAAAGCEVEPYMPKLFADLVAKKDIREILAEGGAGGGGAGAGAGAAAGGDDAGAAAVEEEEEEEEAADMGGLFGGDDAGGDY